MTLTALSEINLTSRHLSVRHPLGGDQAGSDSTEKTASIQSELSRNPVSSALRCYQPNTQQEHSEMMKSPFLYSVCLFEDSVHGCGPGTLPQHLFSERDCSSLCDVVYLSSACGLWRRGAGSRPARKGSHEREWEPEFPRPLPDHPPLPGRHSTSNLPNRLEPHLPDERTRFLSTHRFLRPAPTLPRPFQNAMRPSCHCAPRHMALIHWQVTGSQRR